MMSEQHAPDIIPETPDESTSDIINRLAALDPIEYDQCRQAEAENLGIRTSTLDIEVRSARIAQNDSDQEQGRVLSMDTPEPWPEPVDAAQVLDEVHAMLGRFVVADPPTLRAATLWAAFTHFIDVAKVAPIANITAPEKNCGKSTLLECFNRLSPRAMKADNISPSAIFRVIEMYQPTLLIDEVDAFLKDNESARNILNSGHEPGGYVVRVVGEEHEPRAFRTFSAKALCGIGSIQSTLQSRSLRLELRRKLPNEKAQNLKFSDPEQWDELKRKLARVREDLEEQVRRAGPCTEQGLTNRAADNWQPLFAIADAAGGDWPKEARRAAHQLESLESEPQGIGAELLADVKEVFDQKRVTRIWGSDLLGSLLEDSESPWPTYNRGKPLSNRQLANMLKPYGGRSKDIKINGRVQKGYQYDDLKDAFTRYLTDSPDRSATTLQPTHGADSGDSRSATGSHSVADRKSPEALGDRGRSAVADKNPVSGSDDVEVF